MTTKIKLLISGSFLFAIILWMMSIVLFPQKSGLVHELPTPLPTPTPIYFNSPKLYQHNTVPPVSYSQDAVTKLNTILSPAPLSSEDQQVKTSVLKTIDPNIPTVMATDTFKMEYIQALDEFLVEIRTTDIDGAKNDVRVWLHTFGFSDSAVCKLKVVFYLNSTVANLLRNSKTEFSPVFTNC